ncbi:beta-1,3-galactosyltransferase 1-like [Elysia marginata]|uniref:Hexosyltransferase n=1 Tax=Elysia marginata TaxID=1093978 RepID=A0AAV4IXW5_9GAST|nr:beta-1,3-galactosyltransferase 1-like [Elysia marginata]
MLYSCLFRRKFECCARLSSPRNALLAIAILSVAVYSTMTALRTGSAAPAKKLTVLREVFRNVSRTASAPRHVSASPVADAKAQRSSQNGSVSDGKDSPVLEAILARFKSRVATAVHSRRVVNTHPFGYIHNAPEACTSRSIEIMFGVPSRIDSFTQRHTIRQTWGQYAADPNNKAVLLFFLGRTRDKGIQERVKSEAQKHGDIVQETFIDAYRNLSLKSIALVKWASLYCQESTFVLKADDDMYINVHRLLSKLRTQFEKGPLFIMGTLHPDSKPFRTKGHKWFMPPSEYRQKKYPNYVSGTAYAMTTTAAMRLYVESFYVRSLFLEDVYLTGILADKASVPRVSESEFSAQKIDPTGCNFKGRISGHRNSPEEIRKIHVELFDPDLRCKK